MALEQLSILKGRMEDMRKQIETEAKLAFSQTAKSIFEKHPSLESFQWRQYTPYFNDGEECEFSAHIDEYDIETNGCGRYDGDAKNYNQPAAFEAAILLRAIGEDFLKSMFGDHCQVVAKRDGTVTVEEYSHD